MTEQDPKPLTTMPGARMPENRNSSTGGACRPIRIPEGWVLEGLDELERVAPGRRMHAKGSGVHSGSTVTYDI